MARWIQALLSAQQFLSPFAQLGIIAITGGLVLALVGAAIGLWPWFSVIATTDAGTPQDIGIYLQLGATAFALMLAVFLPANARMAALESSHRNFQIDMHDIARAYRIAHEADRANTFTLSSDFDHMRAKMEFMRAHPDLRHLEPELLHIAAQMSLQSRDLALTYSHDKIERAKQFLLARQQEVDLLADRITQASRTCDDLRLWATDIDVEERAIKKQMALLDEKLRELLPQLGYDFDFDDPRLSAHHGNVFSLNKAAN